jgi:hypothetical protein
VEEDINSNCASAGELVEKNRQWARNIYDDFIAPGSPFQVQLSDTTVQKIEETFDEKEDYDLKSLESFRNMYDPACREILKTLFQEPFQRFRKTGAFESWVNGEKKEDRKSTVDLVSIPKESDVPMVHSV